VRWPGPERVASSDKPEVRAKVNVLASLSTNIVYTKIT
jgi:hypothetical protein